VTCHRFGCLAGLSARQNRVQRFVASPHLPGQLTATSRLRKAGTSPHTPNPVVINSRPQLERCGSFRGGGQPSRLWFDAPSRRTRARGWLQRCGRSVRACGPRGRGTLRQRRARSL